jgi:hypothetical protein
MIAVITSTIKPAENKSYYSYEERLEQTTGTIVSLRQAGFNKIYLVDNSPALSIEQLRQLIKDDENLEVHHVDQYQFTNKGINELLMLLYICPHLPVNDTIFKISGRYVVTSGFEKPNFDDFAVRSFHLSGNNKVISTRAYWVKNTLLFEDFLNATLREVFAYPERVVGIRSLLNKIKSSINKKTSLVNVSIEFAAANVLKRSNYNVSFLDKLKIEGLVAGSDRPEKIIE